MKNNYFLHDENKLKAVIKFMQKAHLRVNTRGKVMAYTCGAQTVSLHDGYTRRFFHFPIQNRVKRNSPQYRFIQL